MPVRRNTLLRVGLVTAPVASADPAAGRGEVGLSVAGVSVRLRAADDSLLLPPRGASSGFSGTEGLADLLLDVRRSDLSTWRGDEALFETGGSWRLEREGARLSFACLAAQRGTAPYAVARLEPSWTRGEVLVDEAWAPPGVPLDPLQFPLDEVLFTHLLAQGRGLLLHACGVVLDGRGVVFAGHSGDGKTTTARLWDGRTGARVVSDDRVVLAPDGGGFRMCGTPWHGEGRWAEPESAPVSAIFLLEKAPEPGLVPIGPAEAAAGLLARSFVPFHPAASLDWSLGFLARLVESVPCHVLRFRPDESAADFVERWLEGRT